MDPQVALKDQILKSWVFNHAKDTMQGHFDVTYSPVSNQVGSLKLTGNRVKNRIISSSHNDSPINVDIPVSSSFLNLRNSGVHTSKTR